ncbi:MAG: phosphatase PAP2 family protein [Proteobacteria bacterium]|nr:phosphatase PAP2 family protein [Pseudomonadota bacterium]MBI3496950.1 phosphatase PAP2 family protein [Pseudomonadota bacterium]
MRKITSFFAILFLASRLLSGASVHAEGARPFITAEDLDLLVLLPPPPRNDSAQTKAELGEILILQVTRTSDMEARAKADVAQEIWRFADVMGPQYAKDALPKFARFFERVVTTEGAVNDPAKDVWKRPRPHLYSDLVKPTVPLSKSGSYPSGHATVGTLMGIVLSNMVPEKRAEIMARAWEYGHNRLVGGIHYASDIEAGRIAGSVIAATIMTRSDFQTEFAAARAELRAALGL